MIRYLSRINVNEPTVSEKKKILRKKLTFCCILKATEEKSRIRILTKTSRIRKTFLCWSYPAFSLCVAWAQFAACGWRSCRTTTSGFLLGRRTTTAATLWRTTARSGSSPPRSPPTRSSRNQGCGSGSGLDPDSIGPVDSDPDPGGQKLPTKVEKK